ncbi:MAG: alpha/beta fold hydrolase [Pseudomonadota bacterium]|nr:alpha/beta fold hydrolase [Pseudomonadota bacterium]
MPLLVFVFLVFVYGLILVHFYFEQRKMLYCPEGNIPAAEDLRAHGLRLWPAEDGQEFVGLLGGCVSGDCRGTVIIFHGNAGTALDRYYYLLPLKVLGYRVLLAEYPGYGGRPGKPSEETYVVDARKIIARVHAEFPGPLYLWGESLGCGIVAAVAAESRADGVVMLTPWDSLATVAKSYYWYLPVRWLLRDRYDNLRNLLSFNWPVAVLVAEKDKTIPKRFGLHLHAQLPEPKKLWFFAGAGHSDWPSSPEEKWWAEVMDFLVSH